MLRFCAEPRCPNLVPKGRCPEHSQQVRTVQTRYRLSSRPWDRLRSQFLAYGNTRTQHQQPVWCAECLKEGKKVVGNEVDHVIPHRCSHVSWNSHNEPCCLRRRDIENLALLCRTHHAVKTASETLNAGK
jgi:hypothetical protein